MMATFEDASPHESSLTLNTAMRNPQTITLLTGQAAAVLRLLAAHRPTSKSFDQNPGKAPVPWPMASKVTENCLLAH
jgi:hypothetical protein